MLNVSTPGLAPAAAHPRSENVLYVPQRVWITESLSSFLPGQPVRRRTSMRTEYAVCALSPAAGLLLPVPPVSSVRSLIMGAEGRDTALAERQLCLPTVWEYQYVPQAPARETNSSLPECKGRDFLPDHADAVLSPDSAGNSPAPSVAGDNTGNPEVSAQISDGAVSGELNSSDTIQELSGMDSADANDAEITKENDSDIGDCTAAPCKTAEETARQTAEETAGETAEETPSDRHEECKRSDKKKTVVRTQKDKKAKRAKHNEEHEEWIRELSRRERRELEEKKRREMESRRKTYAIRQAVTKLRPLILPVIAAEMAEEEIKGILDALEKECVNPRRRNKDSDKFYEFKRQLQECIQAQKGRASAEGKSMAYLASEAKLALAEAMHTEIVGMSDAEEKKKWESIRARYCETNQCYSDNSGKMVTVPKADGQKDSSEPAEETIPWHRAPHCPCIPPERLRSRDEDYFTDRCPTAVEAEQFVDYVFTAYEMVCNIIIQYSFMFVENPGRDFTRTRLISFPALIHYTMQQGNGSLLQEIGSFFGYTPLMPSPSAMTQARSKVKPICMRLIFHLLSRVVDASGTLDSTWKGMLVYALDGSIVNVPSNPEEPETQVTDHCSQITMHACLDINNGYYVDAVLGTPEEIDERGAAAVMIKRNPRIKGYGLFLADRGYPSWLLLATLLEERCHFLFRIKDAESFHSALERFYPEFERYMEANGITSGELDTTIVVRIVKSQKAKFKGPQYKYIKDFPYCEGPDDVYTAMFRVIRKKLPSGEYECLITNLSQDFMTADEAFELYHHRWAIETSFLRFKWRSGGQYVHHKERNMYEQEIYGTLTQFNISSCIAVYLSRTAEYQRRVKAALEEQANGKKGGAENEDDVPIEAKITEDMFIEMMPVDSVVFEQELDEENAEGGKPPADEDKEDKKGKKGKKDKKRKYCTNFNLAQLMVRQAIARIGRRYLTVSPASTVGEMMRALARFNNETERLRGPFSRDGKRSIPTPPLNMLNK